jgi:hypothetical protein
MEDEVDDDTNDIGGGDEEATEGLGKACCPSHIRSNRLGPNGENFS